MSGAFMVTNAKKEWLASTFCGGLPVSAIDELLTLAASNRKRAKHWASGICPSACYHRSNGY
jgi:hypothetical protein